MSGLTLSVSAVLVFFFSGLLAMAGLGAAFIFVPLFLFLGVPILQATSTALLLNVISLALATYNYWRGNLIDWPVGVPVLIAAVVLAPLGARAAPLINADLLIAAFAAFLVFAGFMMIFYNPPVRERQLSRTAEITAGAGIGTIAGFLGGLLGVGGGNFILPVLNWFGLEARVAAGTTALVVVFSSLSGFLGRATVGALEPVFLIVTAVAAAAGSFAGSQFMRTRLSSRQLKLIIGPILWLIAARLIYDLI